MDLPNSLLWRAVAGGLLATLLFASPASAQGHDADPIFRVGVLAHRGPEVAAAEWLPLMDYLGASIEGRRFELVPVTLISAAEKISSGEIEFLITNPGHFVTLAEDYHVTAIATRERVIDEPFSGLATFGTAILVRSDSDIQSIADLRGKHLAAVSRDAFGGFQVAWSEMLAHGVDAFTDPSGLSFMGFPQDAIADAVLRGDADAGIVRSGLLERLETEGRIEVNALKVLNGHSQPDYPYRITGHRFPEWPFIVVPGVDRDLTNAVLVALLATQNTVVQRNFGLRDAWSYPASYEAVRDLVSEFRASNDRSVAKSAWPFSRMETLTLAMLCALVIVGILRVAPRARETPASSVPRSSSPAGESAHDPLLRYARERFEHLTPREREILALICEGEPSKTIALKLGVSPKTVEFHRSNLLRKTEAGSTAHLVQLATRLGFDLGFPLGENAHQ